MNKRQIISQQDSLLDQKGKMKIGVFTDYFKSFNLLDRKRAFLKRFINQNTLTEWQAIEILQEDIFLIAAVFKMGIINKTLCFVYNLKTHELTDFSSTSLFKYQSIIAPSLTNKSLSRRESKNSLLEIMNELEKGQLLVKGLSNNLTFNIELSRFASPIVISLPMSLKHTVYTEKDLLLPEGIIKFNHKEYKLSSQSIAILDDHRGYYPLSSGYDWFTCMGSVLHNNIQSKFGINLTSFYRSLDDTVSENGFWLHGKFHSLPQVTFSRKNSIWRIKDSTDYVDLTFTVHNQYVEKKFVGFKIDYTLAFGEVSGRIKLSETEFLTIDALFSLGEKRLTKALFTSPYKTKK